MHQKELNYYKTRNCIHVNRHGEVRPFIVESKIRRILERRDELEKVFDKLISLSPNQLDYLLHLPEDQIQSAIIHNKMPRKDYEKTKKQN